MYGIRSNIHEKMFSLNKDLEGLHAREVTRKRKDIMSDSEREDDIGDQEEGRSRIAVRTQTDTSRPHFMSNKRVKFRHPIVVQTILRHDVENEEVRQPS